MAGFRKGRFQINLRYDPEDLQLLLAHAQSAGQAEGRYDTRVPCHLRIWTHPRSAACRAESCLMFSLQFDATSITAVTMHADYGWSVFLDELARLETAALGRTVHGRFLGIPTGLRDLDRLTGGLRRGELAVVASQSNVLATDLALHMVRYAAVRAKARNALCEP